MMCHQTVYGSSRMQMIVPATPIGACDNDPGMPASDLH